MAVKSPKTFVRYEILDAIDPVIVAPSADTLREAESNIKKHYCDMLKDRYHKKVRIQKSTFKRQLIEDTPKLDRNKLILVPKKRFGYLRDKVKTVKTISVPKRCPR